LVARTWGALISASTITKSRPLPTREYTV
jgi:hypothetical protein